MANSNISDDVLNEDMCRKMWAEINQLKNEVNDLRSRIAESDEVISTQVEEIREMRLRDVNAREDMEVLRRETEETETFLREMGVQLASQRTSIEELKRSGELRDLEMAELRQQMDRERDKEEEMQNILDIMREEIQDMRNEMERIRGVTSFRDSMNSRERDR